MKMITQIENNPAKAKLILNIIFIFFIVSVRSQNPCMPITPAFTINLTGYPAGYWSSPDTSRIGQCCGLPINERCVYFNLTLDPNSAGIQIDMIGADPAGSLSYSFACGGQSFPGGTLKCVAGVGPHNITFCKPGNNKNIYKITSISKPLFPKDDTIRIGCKKKFNTLGIVNNSVTWAAISGTSAPQNALFNSYLDSLNVASPTYSPGAGAPFFIDYQVCGFPQASACGFSLNVCDTVRIYNYPSLSATVVPNPATFCNTGPGSGVTLSTSVSGGLPPYTYTWTISPGTVSIGNGSAYFANANGLYNVKLADNLYNPATCPAFIAQASVSQGTVPVVTAGPGKKVCANNPLATVSGTVLYASPLWTSNGTGTFTPGNNYAVTSYSPSSADIIAGSVKLYINSVGAGGGCANGKDSLMIYYSQTPTVTLSSSTLSCFNGTATINSLVSGGTAPLSYLWNTGATTSTTGGGQGVYSVYVSDSLGCSSAANYSLIAPNALNLTFNITNVTVNGGSDGTASVTVGGGTPAYSVTWAPGGANTFSISNLSYGIYTAIVTDANGCSVSASGIVNEPQCLGFNAVSAGTNVSCFEGTDGIASVTVSGGTPAYTYTWNTIPAQTNSIAINLYAGVYSVLISDNNGCLQTANVVINQPAQITNVMTQTNVFVIGGNTGAAATNAFGGTLPYSYLWNYGPTTSSVSGLIAGAYSVTITDNQGCTKSDAVNITQPPCNNLTLNLLTNNILCFGGNNGSALAIVTGATGSYSVNWSNGFSGLSVGSLSAGNYSVLVSDSKGCSNFLNFSITQPSQLSVGLLPVNVSCYNKADGTIDLTTAGGTIPYSFAWSNGSLSEDLVNLSPATYSVQVFDANGCSASIAAIITQPSALNVNYVTQSVTCIYGNNGAIGVSPSGGVAPYTYTWSTGATSQSITNLSAGGYTVSVKDANNCKITNPLFISMLQPDSIKVDTFVISCSIPGSGLTQVITTPTGGISGTYSLSFNNGLTYLPAGVTSSMLINGQTYSVVIQDANGCLSLVPDILTIPNEVKTDSVVFAKCYAPGTTTTLATVYSSGGDNGPYSVSLNNGGIYYAQGTYTFNLSTGNTYTVVVKDTRNCVSGSTIITLPSPLNASAGITSGYNGQNISCFGLTNGSASVTPTGGSGSYTYSWSTVPTQTNISANNLGAGTYSIIVIDQNNCSVTRTITLTQPTVLTSTAIITSNYNGQNISCFGLTDGSASVTANGGAGAYSFNWNSVPTQTTAAATNLSAGIYSVIVNDINNCSVTATVSLSQPSSIMATVSVTSNYNGQQISCFGASNGSAIATASNGTSPFTFTWSAVPPQTGTLATNLSAGIYSMIATDANGCSITNTLSVNQPVQLTATTNVTSNYNGQNISCFGLTDGSASISPSGGTGSYTYSWTSVPTQTTASATNLGAGIYSVIVTDINGCNFTNSVTLTQPAVLSATANVTSNYNGQNISCFGLTNGSALAIANGGTGAYTYSWTSIPSQTTAAANNLGAGTYSVIVKDINNCAVTKTLTLTQPIAITATAAITSNYNGQNISCFGLSDGSSSVTANGGTGAYSFNWNTVPSQTTATATNLSAGVYSVIVNDINNCSVTATVSVTQPAAIIATVSVTSNYNGQQISCFGASNGSAIATASNGTSPFTYTWSTVPPQTGTLATNLSAGNYSIFISDINGCQITKTLSVTQPSSLAATTSITSNYNGENISCFGLTDGSASVSPSGGTGPYTYNWTSVPTQTTASATNLGAGIYSVSVTDINGCNLTNSVLLTQPSSVNAAVVSLSNYNGFNVSCFGSNNGNIDISLSGGTGSYNYLWSNAAITQDINNIPAGNYSVIATDLNGCTDTLSVLLTQPSQLLIIIDSLSNYNGYNIKCNGSNNGSIYVTVSGGVTAYSYLWSNGNNNQNLNGAGAGGFTLTVVDQNNCVSVNDTSLTQAPPIFFTANISGPLCNGVANGAIDLTTGGGVSPFVYNWSNGATTEDINNISAGTFTVIYEDKNGCVDSAAIIVTQPQALGIIKDITQTKCYGDTTAKVAVTINGGTVPYTYLWSNGSTVSLINNLKHGTYSIKITDANGCFVNDTTIITQPDSLKISLYSPVQFSGHNISYPNGSDGSIDLTVTGGTIPYDYQWSNSSADEDQLNVIAGIYYVTVNDANGCKVSGDIVLTTPLILEMPSGFSPNNDGENDLFVIHGIEAYPDNVFTVYNRWGNIVYKKDGYKNEWNGTNNSENSMPDATYFVLLEINGGEKVLKGYVELRR